MDDNEYTENKNCLAMKEKSVSNSEFRALKSRFHAEGS
jgi:hypothetical protein